MKCYPSTSITRLSGDILAEAVRAPVMITKYRKPGYVIMAADKYVDLVRGGASKLKPHTSNLQEGEMGHSKQHADANELEVLKLFAEGGIDRYEAEERTGLYFSELLIRMGELGIKRQAVGMYDRMTPEQRKLFDEVFAG